MPPQRKPGSKPQASMGGGGGNPNKSQDVVRIGGADLVRTREANGEVTYRPVDAKTGTVVDAATFEARKKEERERRLANDPRARERAASEWAANMRGTITKTRVDEAQKLRREETKQRERASGTSNPKRRTKALGAVTPSKALAELREEMRVAIASGMQTKNPGSYSFLKAALDVEEAKYAKLVDAARKREYTRERSKRGVRGDAGLDAELSDGDEDDVPQIRGSLEDLDDPDYRRGPAPMSSGSGARGSIKTVTEGVEKLKVKSTASKKDVSKPKSEGAKTAKAPAKAAAKVPQPKTDADDPDYKRGPPPTNLSAVPAGKTHGVGYRGSATSGRGGRGGRKSEGNGRGGRGRGGRGNNGILVFDT